MELCATCGGNGVLPLRNEQGERVGVTTCRPCKGRGEVVPTSRAERRPCPDCAGKGEVTWTTRECPTCGGRGDLVGAIRRVAEMRTERRTLPRCESTHEFRGETYRCVERVRHFDAPEHRDHTAILPGEPVAVLLWDHE